MTKFMDLTEEEKNKQRAIAAELMGNGAFADKEGIDLFLELESTHDGNDRIDIDAMAQERSFSEVDQMSINNCMTIPI